MSVGARLKSLRIQQKRSLQDVADAVGASKAHIWELERGGSRNPSMDLLKKLAQYFRVSVSFLVGEDVPREDEDLIVLFRDFQGLDERDREAFQALIKRFKERKAE